MSNVEPRIARYFDWLLGGATGISLISAALPLIPRDLNQGLLPEIVYLTSVPTKVCTQGVMIRFVQDCVPMLGIAHFRLASSNPQGCSLPVRWLQERPRKRDLHGTQGGNRTPTPEGSGF